MLEIDDRGRYQAIATEVQTEEKTKERQKTENTEENRIMHTKTAVTTIPNINVVWKRSQ